MTPRIWEFRVHNSCLRGSVMSVAIARWEAALCCKLTSPALFFWVKTRWWWQREERQRYWQHSQTPPNVHFLHHRDVRKWSSPYWVILYKPYCSHHLACHAGGLDWFVTDTPSRTCLFTARDQERDTYLLIIECLGKRGIVSLLGVIHGTLTRWGLIDWMVGSCRPRGSGQAGVSPLLQSCSEMKGRDGWRHCGGRKGTSLSYWEGRWRERERITACLSWSGIG